MGPDYLTNGASGGPGLHDHCQTRSEAGNRWCERIWTVIATCTQQGRSVFAYLEAVVGAWFDGTEAPSLLPGG